MSANCDIMVVFSIYSKFGAQSVKLTFSLKVTLHFSSWDQPQKTTALVTFTEDILNGRLFVQAWSIFPYCRNIFHVNPSQVFPVTFAKFFKTTKTFFKTSVNEGFSRTFCRTNYNISQSLSISRKSYIFDILDI